MLRSTMYATPRPRQHINLNLHDLPRREQPFKQFQRLAILLLLSEFRYYHASIDKQVIRV